MVNCQVRFPPRLPRFGQSSLTSIEAPERIMQKCNSNLINIGVCSEVIGNGRTHEKINVERERKQKISSEVGNNEGWHQKDERRVQ